jgi:MerC mercury resistance protein
MQISMSSATRTSHIDRIGAGVSFVCAVHCALMPFVIALLPFVGHRGLLFVYGHFVNHRLRHCVQPCCAADLVGQDSFRNPELNPGISRTSNHRIESTSD